MKIKIITKVEEQEEKEILKAMYEMKTGECISVKKEKSQVSNFIQRVPAGWIYESEGMPGVWTSTFTPYVPKHTIHRFKKEIIK